MKVSELYKIDILSFNTQIGYITNLGTTFYEMQSLYEKGSPEFIELNNRLKLCCLHQGMTIDSAKGIETTPLPKHWTKYTKIIDDMSEEEKNVARFNNKLVVAKRPYFMRYLYPEYNVDYKNHIADFDRYCLTKYNCKFKELPEEFKNTDEYKELKRYYNYRSPLLETNGVMNRVCYYLENSFKDIKKRSKYLKNSELFGILTNNVEINNEKLEALTKVYDEYTQFKHNKMLLDSEFSTYEQFYKYLRNKSLETISSNMGELANLSVYLCYCLNKNKSFAWDVFGKGIVDNIIDKKIASGDTIINVPKLSESGSVEYLGDKYEFIPYNIASNDEEVYEFDDFDDLLLDIDSESLEDLNDNL